MADVTVPDFRATASTVKTDISVEDTHSSFAIINPWVEATTSVSNTDETHVVVEGTLDSLAVINPWAEATTPASNTTKTDVLVVATLDSFAIINPWTEAKSTNRAVQEFIQALREECERFLNSVAQSCQSAQAGHSFAENASGLCDNLLKPEISDEDLRAYIVEMRDIAQKAHKNATTTADMFRSNRKGLNRVVASLPATKESMSKDHEEEQMNKAKADRSAEAWEGKVEMFSPLSNKAKRKKKKKDTTPSAFHVAGAVVALPVTLPLLFVAKARLSSFKAQAEEINRRAVAIKAEIHDFFGATERLGDLAENINIMADYWSEMESMVGDVHRRVFELQKDLTLHIEVRGLVQDWRHIGGEYFAYNTQSATLRATLRATRLQTKTITEGENGSAGQSSSRKSHKARKMKGQ